MVRATVVEYMRTKFLIELDDEITESTDLFTAGIMDSFGYVQLMQFLQSKFEVKFTREELLSNVLTSLSEIVAAVERKLAARAG